VRFDRTGCTRELALEAAVFVHLSLYHRQRFRRLRACSDGDGGIELENPVLHVPGIAHHDAASVGRCQRWSIASRAVALLRRDAGAGDEGLSRRCDSFVVSAPRRRCAAWREHRRTARHFFQSRATVSAIQYRPPGQTSPGSRTTPVSWGHAA
jgi:hypothetical protein